MKRWWVSWYETSEDYRPIVWPLPPGVAHYWCSGHRGSDDAAMLCAIVDAASEADAKALIGAARPEAGPREWRFCEEKVSEWMPETARFPPRRLVRLKARHVGERYANLDDGTCWPLPEPERGDHDSVAWAMRYAQELSSDQRCYAASVIGAYEALLAHSGRRRDEVVAAIRAALTERDNRGGKIQ